MEILQALTFDDVMLVPAASSVLPAETYVVATGFRGASGAA